MTFVEVGGHSGITTEMVLEVPDIKVIVIEPNMMLFQRLVRKYWNNLRVEMVHGAMWDKSEERDLYIPTQNGASSLHVDKTDLDNPIVQTVRCIEASKFIACNRDDDPDIMMNLNCEGAELEIMNNVMDNDAWHGVKFFIKSHKGVMPEPERYDAMIQKMKDLGVDYKMGQYSEVYRGAKAKNVSATEILKAYNKEHWADWFPKEE